MEKVLNCQFVESSSRVAEKSSIRFFEGQTSSSSGYFGGQTSSSRSLEVNDVFESVMTMRDNVSSPMELRKGMTFNSKDELMHVVKQFHIRSHQEFVVTRSSDLNWDVACKWKVMVVSGI